MVLRRLVGLITLAVASTLISCGESVEIDRSRPVNVRAAQDSLDTWAGDGVGGVIGAVRVGRGNIVTLAAGNEPDGQALTADSIVRVGSVTKTFVATLVLDLVEDGALELDDRLVDHLPDTPVGGQATIEQLLSHRSGIYNYTDEPVFLQAALDDLDRAIPPGDIISFAPASRSTFDPGEEFGYSNTNYILLGQLLEEVSGQSVDDLLSERITEPLGLTNTGFDDGSRTEVVAGYSPLFPAGDTRAGYRALATGAWTAGSAVTTVGELARFFDGLIAGRILEPATVDSMFEMRGDGEYALGIHVGSVFGAGHGGLIAGFAAEAQIDRSTGDLLVVVVNNDLRPVEVAADRLWAGATSAD